MKKTCFLLLLLILYFYSFSLAADNAGRNVYSIFSENFNGVKIDWWAWDGGLPDDSLDNAQLFTWTGGNNYINISTMSYSSTSESNDGNIFWRITTSGLNGWSGMSVTFRRGAYPNTSDELRNMAAYSGGTIEFWAKSNQAGSVNYRVGVTDNDTGVNNGNRVARIGDLGFTADNSWQKIVVPINSLGANLNLIKNVFLMLTDNIFANIDIDCVVWKKASGGSFNVTIRNISDNSAAAELTWDESAIAKRWIAAQQYLELDLDSLQSDSWGIQIYTDNTSESANPKYTGNIDADTNGGLICDSDTARMLPICWRVTDKLLPYTDPAGVNYSQTLDIGYNDGGTYDEGTNAPDADTYYCWFAMKDRAVFGLTPEINNGTDYLRVWDMRGFHSAPGEVNYWGMSPGAMYKNMILPKIYLGADFGTAMTPMVYQTNSLVIELFYE